MAYTQPTVRATGYKVLATDWNVFVNNELQRWTSTGFAWSGQDMSVANGYGQIIGHASQITQPQASEFQILGTASVDSSAILGRWGADANAPALQFVKSRDAVIFDGTYVIVADNDKIGGVEWYPDDGVDLSTLAADFHAEVDDGSPAAGDIGMAFVWDSMAGGGAAIAERMRLSAAGDLSLVTAAADMAIPAGGKYYFDGGGDTYAYEESTDDLHIVVGGVIMAQLDQEAGLISFNPSAGDYDFAIDTDDTANAFHVDAGANGGKGSITMGYSVNPDANNRAWFKVYPPALTTASGKSTSLMSVQPDYVLTMSGTVPVAATLQLEEPNLSGTPTTAATLYIKDAPTEGGTNNAAIYVAAGDVILGGDIDLGDDQQIRFGDADDALLDFDGSRLLLQVSNEQPFAIENTTEGSKARFSQQTKNTQGVSTSAVEIMDFEAPGSDGMLCMVVGHLNTGADTAFLDLLLCPEEASGTPVVIASTNTRGTPAARTYSIGTERQLKLLVAANTYDVSVHCISGAPSPL